ncbi:Carboxypeptidase Y [Zancudomyces culisetae]|uniref:Carboxypeptidase n=1 Tax=Zancudomyces culisetae TaxID=1213189 RepID=A0A1R1PPA1_ZANCU|nr:Carboxypeptidase Y [Zancudomyces culisetae]|eukprot:OMH82797.1 Carboxypeptidase Y [Zancudomyces culisetae]
MNLKITIRAVAACVVLNLPVVLGGSSRQKVLQKEQLNYVSEMLREPFFYSERDNYEAKKNHKPKYLEEKENEWKATVQMEELKGYQLRVKQPKLCTTQEEKSYSGYIDIEDKKHFFFWFFEAQNGKKDAPIVLWMNGGPGCSSFAGLLMELGPCYVNEHGNGTVPNAYGWNKEAHVIFLDQPLNVGFSYGKEDGYGSIMAGKDVYAFLQLFVKLFDEYKDSPLHVFGESYAGHYVPATAKAINEGNRDNVGLNKLNLVSIGIGNGISDPLEQYKYYGKMACNSTYPPVLSQSKCDKIDSHYPTCSFLIKGCYRFKNVFACVPPSQYCNSNMMMPYYNAGLNPYDVRVMCEGGNLCYPITQNIEKFLNHPHIQRELGSDVSTFELCSQKVYSGFLLNGDWMKPYMDEIPPLLESGIKVLIYAGDADWICNWYGNKAFLELLEWSGKAAYNNATDRIWQSVKVPNSKFNDYEGSGKIKSHGGLTFLQLFEAGHMVPYDQPENSLDMINRWVSGTL